MISIFSFLKTLPIVILLLLIASSAAGTQDMRALQIKAREGLQDLQQKADNEKKTARREAALSRKDISSDQASLARAIEQLETEIKLLDKSVASLLAKENKLQEQETILSTRLATTDSMVRDLVDVIRSNAKEVEDYISENIQTALTEINTDFLRAIGEKTQFPGVEDISKMAEAVCQLLVDGGSVRMSYGPIIDRNGNSIEAEILILGNFSAFYRLGEEVGFLNYTSASRKLFAVSRLPTGRLQKQLRRYMEGRSEAAPIDISRGGALSKLTHNVGLWQQIEKGGPLIWPIFAILSLGFVIVVERMIYLFTGRIDGDKFTGRIESMVVQQDWQACKEECNRLLGKPVARVVAAGLSCCKQQREVMENALQEAILKEVPPMERFLSTLGMLAAIAPLLGLLGTVTGMIDTFQVITLHGTGDPRMMSGGISVALVTTMLGLSVAIPIMLAHTLLSREVDKRISQMEEKAVAILNIVDKYRVPVS